MRATFSCVRALTLIRPMSVRSSRAQFSIMMVFTLRSLCSTLTFGFSQMSVTSTLLIRYPRSTMRV